MYRHGAAVNDAKIILRCLAVVGRSDHYAHFFLDFMMPIYHWLYSHGRLYDRNLCILIGDPKAEIFRPIMGQFFNCKIVTSGTLEELVSRHRDMIFGWEAHNRKILGLKLADYIGFPFQYLNDFHEYLLKQTGLTAKDKNKFILVRRKHTDDDRGGGRRNITNHDEVAEAMEGEASRVGMEFVDAMLEDMSFAEQVDLFHNAAVLVAQHGAALCNIMFMRPTGVIVELHKNRKEEYRYRQLCDFFNIGRHSNIVCPLDAKSCSSQGNIIVPVERLSEHVRQEIQRR